MSSPKAPVLIYGRNVGGGPFQGAAGDLLGHFKSIEFHGEMDVARAVATHLFQTNIEPPPSVVKPPPSVEGNARPRLKLAMKKR